jgi:hypothetical protein
MLREQGAGHDSKFVLSFTEKSIRQFKRQGKVWKEIAVEAPEREYFDVLHEFWEKNGQSLEYVDRIQMSASFSPEGEIS